MTLVVKNLPATARRHKRRGFDPLVGKTPWRRAWQPTPVFLPGKIHGQRSLVGYSSWGCKESDMPEESEQERKVKWVPLKSERKGKQKQETWGRCAYGARLLQGEIYTWMKGLTREQGRDPSGDYWGGRINIICVSGGREWRERKRIWDIGFRI